MTNINITKEQLLQQLQGDTSLGIASGQEGQPIQVMTRELFMDYFRKQLNSKAPSRPTDEQVEDSYSDFSYEDGGRWYDNADAITLVDEGIYDDILSK